MVGQSLSSVLQREPVSSFPLLALSAPCRPSACLSDAARLLLFHPQKRQRGAPTSQNPTSAGFLRRSAALCCQVVELQQLLLLHFLFPVCSGRFHFLFGCLHFLSASGEVLGQREGSSSSSPRPRRLLLLACCASLWSTQSLLLLFQARAVTCLETPG